jgi:hypothetical protein
MHLLKGFSDPREQDVSSEDSSFALPSPGVTEPVYLQALRGRLPAETCAACGQPNAYHYDTSGIYFVGCHGVPSRRALNVLMTRSLRETAEYGDPFPAVSSAIRDVLLVGSGQDVAYFYNSLTAEERVNLSRRIAEVAVTAFRAEDAKWNR